MEKEPDDYHGLEQKVQGSEGQRGVQKGNRALKAREKRLDFILKEGRTL